MSGEPISLLLRRQRPQHRWPCTSAVTSARRACRSRRLCHLLWQKAQATAQVASSVHRCIRRACRQPGTLPYRPAHPLAVAEQFSECAPLLWWWCALPTKGRVRSRGGVGGVIRFLARRREEGRRSKDLKRQAKSLSRGSEQAGGRGMRRRAFNQKSQEAGQLDVAWLRGGGEGGSRGFASMISFIILPRKHPSLPNRSRHLANEYRTELCSSPSNSRMRGGGFPGSGGAPATFGKRRTILHQSCCGSRNGLVPTCPRGPPRPGTPRT
jgi:hypothetical protein